jgi:hypothetical protein
MAIKKLYKKNTYIESLAINLCALRQRKPQA